MIPNKNWNFWKNFKKTNSTMDSCLLCLESNNKSKNNIKVNSKQWQELNIQNLIDKHFWPNMKTIHFSSWVCTTCLEQLNEFHQFYERVEYAHVHLSSQLKLEILNEDEIVMQKILETDQNIKDEHADGVYNAALLATNDPVRFDEPLIEDPLQHRSKKCKTTKITKSKSRKIEEECNENVESLNIKAVGQSIEPSERVQLDETKKCTAIKRTKTETSENVKTSITRTAEQCGEQAEPKADSISIDINDDFSTDTDSNFEPDEFSLSNNENKKTTRCNRSKGINDAKNKFISDNFKMSCNICQLPIATFQELLIHFKEEHDQCGYVLCCDKKFFKRNFFLDHLRHHVDPNFLKCKKCDKVCTTSRCLKNHQKVHDAERSKNHCCDICGMNYLTRSGLYSHKTTHLTDAEKLFPCPECSKKFGNKWKLLDHVTKVHGDNEVCDICGLILVNKCALNKHKSLKHMEQDKKEYVCTICSKIYPNQLGLYTHMRNVHKRGYNHKCATCDRAFKTKLALREHVATHTGTDLYACAWCPKTCKSNAYMHKHRKKSHPREWAEEKRKKYAGKLPPDVERSLADIFKD